MPSTHSATQYNLSHRIHGSLLLLTVHSWWCLRADVSPARSVRRTFPPVFRPRQPAARARCAALSHQASPPPPPQAQRQREQQQQHASSVTATTSAFSPTHPSLKSKNLSEAERQQTDAEQAHARTRMHKRYDPSFLRASACVLFSSSRACLWSPSSSPLSHYNPLANSKAPCPHG